MVSPPTLDWLVASLTRVHHVSMMQRTRRVTSHERGIVPRTLFGCKHAAEHRSGETTGKPLSA
jgi:hypothetical protein